MSLNDSIFISWTIDPCNSCHYKPRKQEYILEVLPRFTCKLLFERANEQLFAFFHFFNHIKLSLVISTTYIVSIWTEHANHLTSYKLMS